MIVSWGCLIEALFARRGAPHHTALRIFYTNILDLNIILPRRKWVWLLSFPSSTTKPTTQRDVSQAPARTIMTKMHKAFLATASLFLCPPSKKFWVDCWLAGNTVVPCCSCQQEGWESHCWKYGCYRHSSSRWYLEGLISSFLVNPLLYSTNRKNMMLGFVAGFAMVPSKDQPHLQGQFWHPAIVMAFCIQNSWALFENYVCQTMDNSCNFCHSSGIFFTYY